MGNDNNEIFTISVQMFSIHSEISVVLFHLKDLEETSYQLLLQSNGLLLYLFSVTSQLYMTEN